MLNNTNKIIAQNQIWLCKKNYKDNWENIIEGKDEFYVFISSPPEKLNNEEFVRIQPISSKIEFKSNDDILISDTAVLGYPFIIETWNEQPILTNILDKPVGTIRESLPKIVEPESYTELQLEFRRQEIRNSTYLRQSVLSFLAWEESKEKKSNPKIPMLLLMAAVFIGVIFLIWQPSRLSSNQIYNKFNLAYINSIKIKNGSEENLRGNDCIIPNFSTQECEIIQEALKKYDVKEYNNTESLLKRINNLKARNHLIFFYFTLSQLYSDSINISIENLNYLASFKTESFYEDVQYYLALAYIKNQEITKARRILNSIAKDGGKYSVNSTKILHGLRWF